MSNSYQVKAQVVDISRDTPKSNDTFLVDTNVWFWYSYVKFAEFDGERFRQIEPYVEYIPKAFKANSTLHRNSLSFSELANVIEKTELEIFDPSEVIKSKEFRHSYPDQRRDVVKEIKTAWEQVSKVSRPTEHNLTIDETLTNNILTQLEHKSLDVYDLFLLEIMKKNNINKIITDDQDFATISGIFVFTNNSFIIRNARSQNKLIRNR